MLYIAPEKYYYAKENILDKLPLPQFVIYSLPEGLWVYSVTVASTHLYIPVWHRKLYLTSAPLLFSLILEWMQYTNRIKGNFDIWDIVCSVAFCLLAIILFRNHLPKYNIFKGITTRVAASITCFAFVYLAHVLS